MGRQENENLYVPIGKIPEKTPYERFAERFGLPPLSEMLRAAISAAVIALALILVLFISGMRLKTESAENGVSYGYFGWTFRGKPTLGVMFATDGSSAKIKGGDLYYSDGSVYSGELDGFMKHGKGTLTYADGSVYTGNFELGVFSGEGKLISSDGSGYVGTYKNGAYHGTGTLTVSGEGKYVGTFDMGEKHGEGVFYYENGDVFKGTFSHDMRSEGVYKWISGESITGEFDNNMPSNIKKIIYTDVNGATYKAIYNYMSGRLDEKQRYTPPTPDPEPDKPNTPDSDNAVG